MTYLSAPYKVILLHLKYLASIRTKFSHSSVLVHVQVKDGAVQLQVEGPGSPVFAFLSTSHHGPGDQNCEENHCNQHKQKQREVIRKINALN